MFYLKVLEITSLYTILVLGVYLMTGLTGLFSLGQGGFVSIGAYTAAIAYLRFGIPFPLALALAVLMGAVLGFLVGQVMKVTKGRANPQIATDLMKKKLEEV